MPIYEFQCGSCGKEFEALVRGSSPASGCPSCHGTDLHKKLSTFFASSKTGAASSSAALESMTEACSSCGNPGGPGSCQFE
jgi:putative FmdB family regulatory protein